MHASRTLTICIVIFALASIILAGCGGQSQRPRFLMVGCDNSVSVGIEGVRSYTRSILEVILEDEADSGMKMWTFTHCPETICYFERIGEVENVTPTIDEYLNMGKLSEEQGTFYGPMFSQWFSEARLHPGAQIIGILLTDGDCHDPAVASLAAKQLADMPNFKVLYVAPVDNGVIRSRIERTLEPLKSAHKLIVCGNNDILPGIDSLQEKEMEK